MSKNAYIFSETYPNKDIQDFNSEEAYELGVSAGLDAAYDTEQSKEEVTRRLKAIIESTHQSDFSGALSESFEQVCEDGAVIALELALKLLQEKP